MQVTRESPRDELIRLDTTEFKISYSAFLVPRGGARFLRFSHPRLHLRLLAFSFSSPENVARDAHGRYVDV
jgi:hypothetical protein